MSTRSRPFWQTLVLAILGHAATGFAAYYTARSEGSTETAQQAVRVDTTWDACRTMYESMDRRLLAMESRPAGPLTPARRITLTPPEVLFPKAIPTPSIDDPRVQKLLRPAKE